MKWRNEQIYHLRQNKPLTPSDQDRYFEEVVAKLFDQEQPDQILFSFLKGDNSIGYGGLVHINWNHKNAEISFVQDTRLQNDFFEQHWYIFLGLLEKVAFQELDLHKIYTYAYDIRPRLYPALEKTGFSKEAILKEHTIVEGDYKDVIYHTKYNILHNILLRKASIEDAKLLFDWANEEAVRNNAINQTKIEWENHLKWLKNKIESSSTVIFIVQSKNAPIGQIRLDLIEGWWEVDYSIDKGFRRLGIGKVILKKVIEQKEFFKLRALVKPQNIASIKIFENLMFFKVASINRSGVEVFDYRYTRSL